MHVPDVRDLLSECITDFAFVFNRDVNETLRSETETRLRRFTSSSRPHHFFRDRDRHRDVWFWVRDETEIETLIGRDRDIYRDLDMSNYIW